MELIIIAALSQNNVIGKDNKIPWHYSEDLKRFKRLTMGHAVLMGRKTYESIIASKGSPLEGRMNLVLSSNKNYKVPDNVAVVSEPVDALVVCNERRIGKLYIIGGERVYRDTFSLVERLELTEIHKDFEGDAFFPKYDKSDWKEIQREDKGEYSFVTYERKRTTLTFRL